MVYGCLSESAVTRRNRACYCILCRVQRRTFLEFLKASLPSYTRSSHACHMCEGFISLDHPPALARFAYKALHRQSMPAHGLFTTLCITHGPAPYCLLSCPLVFSSNPILTACSVSEFKLQPCVLLMSSFQRASAPQACMQCSLQGTKGSVHELHRSMPSSATAGPRSLLIETLTTAAGLSSLQMLFLLNCLVRKTSALLILVSPVLR